MLEELERIALDAGKLISQIRAAGANVQEKSDGSPVTDADQAAEELIVRELRKIDPGIAIVAEESANAGAADAASNGTLFFVDPLDGTKEFIRGKTDFTVNICLVENRRPKLGVVFAPARGELFSGSETGSYRCRVLQDASISERTQIRTTCASRAGSGGVTAVASASHGSAETEAFLEALAVGRRISVGSSLKFCMVAAADAHIYPRFGRTMQWDTAAGDAVLRGAGGCTLTCDGRELEYGVSRSEDGALDNPHFISYGGDAETLRALLRAHL